jgi:hypothetical protein
MKKISLKEHFKNNFRRVLSEAAPPSPPPTQSYDPISVNPIEIIRDRITPSWRDPFSTNPWGNQPPNSPWQTVPREVRELFPKGPKQYQRYVQTYSEYYDLYRELIEQLLRWGNFQGLPPGTPSEIGQYGDIDTIEQMIRLYSTNDPNMLDLINRMRELYGDAEFFDRGLDSFIETLLQFLYYGNSVGNSSSFNELWDILRWRSPSGSLYGYGFDDQPSVRPPAGRPLQQWDKKGARNQYPLYFPNGLVLVHDPQFGPTWYQWNENTGEYDPVSNPAMSPAVPDPDPGSPVIPPYQRYPFQFTTPYS